MHHMEYKPLNQLWLKASVVGSVWASIEIILGSFLHNLKIPMSGTILSFLSVYLLVSFFQIWNDKGLILRAGIITALMKSISPSAIILGPMTGILAEALLLELAISLFGKNLAAYMVGGALAVFSALLHKIVTLLIYYGSDLVTILSLLYQFAIKQLHLYQWQNPWNALFLLSGAYFLAGSAAAWLGYQMGKNRNLQKVEVSNLELTFKKERQLFARSSAHHPFALWLLLLHLSAIVGTLWLLNIELYVWSFFIGFGYLTICILFYKQALRRLAKIGIWIQFAAITLLASVVWSGFSEHVFFSTQGITIGFKMIYRALIILIGFSAIGSELKNPSIKSILYSSGFKNIYHALDLSFSALPDLLAHLKVSNKNIRSYKGLLSRFFVHAEFLLHSFTTEDQQKPTVLIITGETHSGKTTFTQGFVNLLGEHKIGYSGFLTLKQPDTTVNEYSLQLLPQQTNYPFITQSARENWMAFRRFYFNTGLFITGEKHIEDSLKLSPRCIILDEIGPLEMENKGWAPLIESLCSHHGIIQIWVVRRSLIPLIVKKWDVGQVYIADIEHDTLEDCLILLN